MDEEQKVVNYEGNTVSLFMPDKQLQREVAYVRPGDRVLLNFDIRDFENVKVEIVNGDLHIIFSNGSSITLASMAAIGFYPNAPQLVTLDGIELSLREFLTVTEVLNYDEALLILANEDQANYSSEEPDMVVVATDQSSEREAGIPISGEGELNVQAQGIPFNIIIPQGTSLVPSPSVSIGPFVSTIWTTNFPYTLDTDNYSPGNIDPRPAPTLELTILYGSQLNREGIQTVGENDYVMYGFQSGLQGVEDPTVQLAKRILDQSTSTDDLFINNGADRIAYWAEIDYRGDIFPSRVDITLPSHVADIVALEELLDTTFTVTEDPVSGDVTYSITDLSPTGIMPFLFTLPYGVDPENFDLVFDLFYTDPITGDQLETERLVPIKLYPITEESHLSVADGFALSTIANPLDVKTGSGDDIIVGGGGDNIIDSGAGDDQIFTYGGNDIVNAGDGDDQIWGSRGDDIIDGGSGRNRIYYDNRNTNIDPTGVYFKNYYYNTNASSTGLKVYSGFNASSLIPFAREGFINAEAVTNDSILATNTNGTDVLKNIDEIYLTTGDDEFILGAENNVNGKLIHGGLLEEGQRDNDTFIIDDSFVGAFIDFSINTVYNENFTTSVEFAEFESFVGSINDEVFYAGVSEDNDAISIDGGGGYNIFSYAKLEEGIRVEFNANTGEVIKKDANDNALGRDILRNIQEIESRSLTNRNSEGNIFYGSFSNSYSYTNLSEKDSVDYSKSIAGVTVVFNDNANEVSVYKTTSYYSASTLPEGVSRDILRGNIEISNIITLSNYADVIIIGSVENSYSIDAGAGRDVLSYQDLSNAITLQIKDGTGIVDKDGGQDTFTTVLENKGVNIYSIVGTQYEDTFIMDSSEENSSGYLLDGVSEKNTLSYKNVVLPGDDINNQGVQFIFADEGNSRVSRSANLINDYFNNFTDFVGTDYDDRVIFSSTADLEQIKGMTFDLGEGTDIVDYSLLSVEEIAGIDISFDGATQDMIVGYRQDGGSSSFANTEGVIGTSEDDSFNAIDGISLYFDGFLGNNTADYSNVGSDLVFSLYNGTVKKGDFNDTLLRVNNIIGGTASNKYYLDPFQSYNIVANGSVNVVSYYYSNRGIQYNLATQEVSKFEEAKDTLEGDFIVKGSQYNDIFVITPDMESGSYTVFGNDIYDEGILSKEQVNPSNDVDIVDLSAFEELAITLDTSLAGSYNVFDENDLIIEEGFISLTLTAAAGGDINVDLYHIEGFKATEGNDRFDIISGYEASLAGVGWNIDLLGGEDTVSYALDENLSFVGTGGSSGNVILASISNQGVFVTRYYHQDGNNLRADDFFTNLEILELSTKDDELVLNPGWEESGIKKVDALEKSDPNSKGDTLNISNLEDDITVDFETDGSFVVSLAGADGDFPEFVNFDNLRLSGGVNHLRFIEGINFSSILEITDNIGEASEANLDFTSLTSSLTVTLNQNSVGEDILEGAINGSLRLLSENFTNNKYVLAFTSENNTVYGSATKHINFTGGDTGSNTLSYAEVTSFGVDFVLGLDGANKVIKQNNISIFDTFDNSFTNLQGTQGDDSFIFQDVSNTIEGYNIDLLGGDNSVGIDIGDVTFDIFSEEVTLGTDAFNIAGVQNAYTLNFFGIDETVENNATIEFTQAYDEEVAGGFVLPKSVYDGGYGSNTLDFSQLDTIIYDSFSFRISSQDDPDNITDYDSISWDQGRGENNDDPQDLIFRRFYTIIGAQNSFFYGQAQSSFSFVGQQGGSAVLDYSRSSSPIAINLLDGEILKNNSEETRDTFNQYITRIVGTQSSDSIVIDKFESYDESLEIDAGGGGGNTIEFKFAEDSGIFTRLSFSSTDEATVELVDQPSGETRSLNINFIGFDRYRLTEGNDEITIDTSFNEGLYFDAGGGHDVFEYIGSESIIYTAQNSLITRAGSIVDTLLSVEEIRYSGSGTATFIGALSTDRIYRGSQKEDYDTTNYSDGVLDYSAQSASGSLVVDFALDENGLMSIRKGIDGNIDYFDAYITKIIGTRGDDEFILAERDASLPKVRLEGGEGSNKVSYGNLEEGTTFVINENGELEVEGEDSSNLFAGYVIDTESIRGYALTNYDDIFYGAFDTNLEIDAGEGSNTIDYSRETKETSFVVNFIGGVANIQKKNINSEGEIQERVDIVDNFQTIILGNLDDVVILDEISASYLELVDAKEGTNRLDASNLSKEIKMELKTGFDISFSYEENVTTYKGFSIFQLGTHVNTVDYYHDDIYLQNKLSFSAGSGSSSTFNFMDGSNTYFLTIVGTGVEYNIATTDGGESFINLENFNSISAKDTTNVMVFTAPGIGNNTFFGGTTDDDEMSYQSTSSLGVTATLATDDNGEQYISVVDNEGNFTDKLYDVEGIELTDGDDTFNVAEWTNYSGGPEGSDEANPFTVDFLGGTNTLSFSGFEEGREFFTDNAGDLTSEGFVFTDYDILELTSGDDTLFVGSGSSATVLGGEGYNIAQYNQTADDTVEGTLVFMDQNLGMFAIEKNVSSPTVKDGKIDFFQDFSLYVLTEFDDQFIFSRGDNEFFQQGVTFDMLGGNNVVNFSGLSTEINGKAVDGTVFTVTGDDVSVLNEAEKIDYTFNSYSEIELGGTNTKLEITTLPTENKSFIGNNDSILDLSKMEGADHTLDLVNGILGNSLLRGFSTIIGSASISRYVLSTLDNQGFPTSYHITLNNSSAVVTYNDPQSTTEIIVNIGQELIVTKGGGSAQDTIVGSFAMFEGTSNSDTFYIENTLDRNISIDGISTLGNTLTFENLSKEIAFFVKEGVDDALFVSIDDSIEIDFRNIANLIGSTSNDTFTLDIGLLDSNVALSALDLINGYEGDNTLIITGEPSTEGSLAELVILRNQQHQLRAGNAIIDIENINTYDLDVSSFHVTVDEIGDIEDPIALNADHNKGEYTLALEVPGPSGDDISLDKDGINVDEKHSFVGFSGLTLTTGGERVSVGAFYDDNAVWDVDSGGSTIDDPDILVFEESVAGVNIVLAGSSIVESYVDERKTGEFRNFRELHVEGDHTSNPSNIWLLQSFDNYGINKIDLLGVSKFNGVSIRFANTFGDTDYTADINVFIDYSDMSTSLVRFETMNKVIEVDGRPNDIYLGNGINTVEIIGTHSVPDEHIERNIYGGTGTNIFQQDTGMNEALLLRPIVIDGNRSYIDMDDNDAVIDYNFYNFGVYRVIDGQSFELVDIDENFFISIIFDQPESGNDRGSRIDIDSEQVLQQYSINEFTLTKERYFYSGILENNSGNEILELYYEVIETKPRSFRTIHFTKTLDDDFTFILNGGLVELGRAYTNFDIKAPTLTEGHDATFLVQLELRVTDDPTSLFFDYVDMLTIGLPSNESVTGYDELRIANHRDPVSAISRFRLEGFDIINLSESQAPLSSDQHDSKFVINFSILSLSVDLEYLDLHTVLVPTTYDSLLILNVLGLSYDNGYVSDNTSGNRIYIPNVTEIEDASHISINVEQSIKNREEFLKNNPSIEGDKLKDAKDTTEFFSLTEGDNVVNLVDINNNTVVDTLGANTSTILQGDMASATYTEYYDDYIVIDGKRYATGGNYVEVTDRHGNKVYLLDAKAEDIFGGNHVENIDGASSVVADNTSTLPIANSLEDYDDVQDGTVTGVDGVASYGSRSSRSSFADNVVDQEEKPYFELEDNNDLDLPVDDEVDIDEQVNQEDQSFEDNSLQDVFSTEEDVFYNIENENNNNISETELVELLEETFSHNESLDDISHDLSEDVSEDVIDYSLINDNLLEDIIIEEKDVDTYKLESEQNNDGLDLLKNHNNNSNNNGSSF